MKTKVLAVLAFAALTTSLGNKSFAGEIETVRSSGTTFGNELAFLKKHTEVIVLSDEEGTAQVVIAPAWQGRVMTSTAQGFSGRSFGWINHEHIASGKIVPHMNIFGGEERFWMGPEGSRFSIFHKGKIDWENWQVPPPLDSLPFKTVSRSKNRASFGAEFSLENYSGTRFQVAVKREIRLLDSQSAWGQLGLQPSRGVSLVAYESHNTLRNTGREPWRKETGLLSIWIAGMHPSSPSSVFVAPIKPGPVSELGAEVTSDYFGAVGPDRLKVTKNAVFFRIDAAYQSKIGIGPRRSLGKFGTYDPQHRTLTIVQFTQPKGATDYVKSLWKITNDPYAGDAINVYNDGPTKPGAKAFGPFQELESSSPAAALVPGGSIEHTHRTIHLTGSEGELDTISRAVLGISLAEITGAFAEAPKTHPQRAVLVTGASSGIGRKITERLAADGYFVYAGARKEADLKALSSIKNVHGVRLDVTKAEDIAATVATVKKEGRGLYGLVNNAGVFSVGSISDYKPEEFDLVMAVNVTAVFRVTQAFLPLITAEKGRITTIGSMTGFLACPGASAYCMSKHAVEGFTDALAGEMEPNGVKVSIIEPGTYKSVIHTSAAARGNMDPRKVTEHQEEPDAVAAAAVHFLGAEMPKRRYLVVPEETQAKNVIKNHVGRLVQLSKGPSYTYDREALIAILDEALAHARPKTQ